MAHPDPAPPKQGVLIRAENGDVVGFDETGLVLRLSDSVLADLRRRLALPIPRDDLAASLGDIDAWGLRQAGDWLQFTARLQADRPPRDYRKLLAGGDIIADAPGALLAILSLGGARRAGFNDGPPGFGYHIVAPGDDVGAVGLEGSAEARPTPALQRLPHSSRDALIAQALLAARYEALQALPLIVARAETDGAASLEALASGQAYANFLVALDSLQLAAATLNKRAQVLAVGIDFGLEDIGDPGTRLRALRGLMARIEADMALRGLTQPVFLLTAESGSQTVSAHPMMLAHADLVWSPGRHRVVIPAPGYAFAQTRFARPTPEARQQMAEIDAHALREALARRPWFCPHFLLAEHQGNQLRVTARAMTDLVIDPALTDDPACGFALFGTDTRITSVAIAPDDRQSLILQLSAPIAAAAELAYAYGGPVPSPDDRPANRGAVRDSWQAKGSGTTLHRWALPALLPCHPGGAEW